MLVRDRLERRRVGLFEEQVDHGRFHLPAHAIIGHVEVGDPLEGGMDRPAGLVAVEHARVDVGTARHRGCVAEQLGNSLDRLVDRALARGLRGRVAAVHSQRHGGHHSRVPGPEVLGAEVLAQLLLEVLVDVVGADVAPPAAVLPSEKTLRPATPALELRDQLMRDRIFDDLLAAHSPLARVVELDGVPAHANVLLSHSRQPDAVILVGVLLASHAEHPDVEQTNGRGQHRLSLEVVGVFELTGQPATKRWQEIGEAEHALELGAIAVLAPARVVQILSAPCGVDTGGLEVTERVGTDPHVLPGGRNDQLLDALQSVG